VEVRPERRDAAGNVLLLRAGTGVAIDPATRQHRSLRASPDAVGSWRSGQVHFSRTPLQDVAQELARYLGQPVEVADVELKAVPISGFLAVKAPEDFIQALPDVVPVRVDRLAGGSWRITNRF
jgi:transmembrane sensor